MLQEISKAELPMEVVKYDVPNLYPEDPYFIIDHPELDNNCQQEFRTRDHRDELNMIEVVFDPINVETTIIVEVTTKIELKPILNESVKGLIQFLVIVDKLAIEEIDEFNSFSSDKRNKARVTKNSCDMEGRKLEVIIP
ncbi:hypothetical protein J1N35_007762 [Gossypium stocksii]|uniref:Uncharacterized protein n=1 Tax=Gossypium stocksii TaxID=47602 RepID=A0A9D3W6P7_9ROSI|nr:hypothetical protein J1N35_007762 [Gossypium stocksii]